MGNSNIYTDGSSSSKGSGFGVFHGTGHSSNLSGSVSGNDNNRAELHAVSAGLKQGSHSTGPGESVTFYIDSKSEINALKGGGRNTDLVQRGQAAMQNISAKGGSANEVHVKGHSRSQGIKELMHWLKLAPVVHTVVHTVEQASLEEASLEVVGSSFLLNKNLGNGKKKMS